MSDAVFAANDQAVVSRKSEGPSLFERVMNPETDENCKVPASVQARQYALGVGGGLLAGPFVGGGLAVAGCVSNIGDAIICGIVGPEKVLIIGAGIGTVVLPVVGGYQAHKSIKDAEASCRNKKGMKLE